MYNGHLSIEEIEQLIQQKGPAENQTHVESCQQCRSMLEDCQAVCAKLEKLASVPIGAERAMKCPDERIWFDVAAGTLPAEESLQHIQHATECSSCGQRLKTATRMFEEELSEQEERAVSSMAGSRRDVQARLAIRMASLGKPIDTHEVKHGGRNGTRRLLWRIPSWAFVVGIALFTFLGFQGYRFFLIQEARQDIRQKYAEGRPTVYRVAGVQYSRAAVTRGDSKVSHISISDWLGRPVLRAQAAFLAHDWLTAIQVLEKARGSGNHSPDVMDNLVVAYALEEERTKNQGLYDKAIDISNEIIGSDHSDSVVYFNRALIYLQHDQENEAKSDLHKFIELELDEHWKNEAREILVRIP